MDASHPLNARTFFAFLLALIAGVTGPLQGQPLTLLSLSGDTGSFVSVGTNSYTMSAQGRGSASGYDQLSFAQRPLEGDFDFQVQMASLVISDPFVRAGLMLRSGPTTNGPFAAVFASSPLAGCFFESRSSTGGTSIRATATGGFPATQPELWLRLKRTGTTVTGYTSTDARSWVQLGSMSFNWTRETRFGLAVSSQNNAIPTTARFLSLAPTTDLAESTLDHLREGVHPSSRRTGLVFSEIFYNPIASTNGSQRSAFIEVANHGDIFQDLSGWTLAGGIHYRFPDRFRLEAGAMVVVAADPTTLLSSSDDPPTLGPWTGSLKKSGDSIELRDAIGAIKLQVAFDSEAPWPLIAGHAGHSLVLISPSYGEADPRAWGPSHYRDGSPGRRDPSHASPDEPVVINEFLAHSETLVSDFIELFNRSNHEVDLSGRVLTDSLNTHRFRMPAGTRIAAGTHRAWNATQLGFRLKSTGETVFFVSADGRRALDVIRFTPQEIGVSSGRFPDGSSRFHRLSSPSPGLFNSSRRAEDLVINELFYNPPGGDADEFIELHHRGATPLDLAGWQLRGGIQFDFPQGYRLEPGQQIVVAKDPSRLRLNHLSLSPSTVAGPYAGQLGNGGDVVRLLRPLTLLSTNQLGTIGSETTHVQVGEVRYFDGGAWGKWSDGGGSSLELIDPESDPSLASSWADSDESTKADWSTVQWTGPLDLGDSAYGLNRLFLGLLNNGECQVDDIEVIRTGGTNFLQNPSFENGNTGWTLGGNHLGSTLGAGVGRNGSRGLHLRAQGGLDTGVNSIRGTLASGLANGNTVTLRAAVRWIAGWPELLFRFRGNYADYPAPLPVPRNLGTPGQKNSRKQVNAGPSLFDISHFPVLPRSGDPVLVTAHITDPQGVTNAVCRFRIDPSTTVSEVPLHDDGLNGDQVAGDCLYSARIPGQTGSMLVAYTLQATDSLGATAIWPPTAQLDEGLIRWNEPIPIGSFPHVHLWTTQSNRSVVGGNALNNAYRRGTLVYGNARVIHSVLYRDKGSPYHSGSGDLTTRVPADELLQGVSERLFSRTGNGGTEETALRGRVSAWIASEMGLPSLSGKYQLFYLNGGSLANVIEDQEEPDHRYAEQHYPEWGEGDLYKISIWFEFADDNRTFKATQATVQKFLSQNTLKPARYRWNWERRAKLFPESNYQTIYNLVNAINSTANSGYTDRVLQLADMDQWMRVFAFHRVTGNWDSWTYNVGQNMYIYGQPGRPAVLLPWDIDFVLGLGDGPTAGLWGGQDPVMNSRTFDHPAFRRMLWRALLRATEGPMLAQNYRPIIDGYRAIQLQNNITGLAPISAITNYINSRRTFLIAQARAADVATFSITSNGGNDFTANTPTVTLTGTAPFRVANIAVNGTRYPVLWTGFTTFSLVVPLAAATNQLQLTGLASNGAILPFTDSVQVLFPGAIPTPADWVILNEIHYNPAEPKTAFVEIHNRHPSTPFDLAGYQLDGLGYTFPAVALIPPGGYWVLAADRAAFAAHFGAVIPLFDTFNGGLDNKGEHLRLSTPDSLSHFSDVRYSDHPPWPIEADGFGPSLQLIDPTLDTRRPANWATTATNAPNRSTPGAINAVRSSLAPFPTAWINEVFPVPPVGVTDSAGDADPFIELYNPASNPTSLDDLWLSDSFTNAVRWAIPLGTSIPAGGFLRIWLDNEPSETQSNELHANFRLSPTSGTVVLARLQGSPASPAILDSLEYENLPQGRGFGSIPDGDPFSRRPLYFATPGASNNPAVPSIKVVINEFMAQNTSTLADPADGDFEDWLELHNAAAIPADLSGYFLTDSLTNRTASVLPSGTIIPPLGFLLVWADAEPQQTQVSNGWFHASFNLARSGEQIALYAPDGSLVDAVTFGVQANNLTTGRSPDGPEGDWIPQDVPTPGSANTIVGGNIPPHFTAVPLQRIAESVRWTLLLQASDPDPGQSLRFSLGTEVPLGLEINPTTGELSWTPNELQGPATYRFSARVTDSGSPNRSATLLLQVEVKESNQSPNLDLPSTISIGEGALLSVQLTATDADRPSQKLRYSLESTAPLGLSIAPDTGLLNWVPSETQGNALYTVAVIVTDDGTPPASITRLLQINVDEIDNIPIFTQPGPQIVREGTPLLLTLSATDPEGSPVRYSLQSTPPEGLSLDPLTGVLQWTPAETQGPNSYTILVEATELSSFAQSARTRFSILVEEDNQPPILTALPAQSRTEGELIELRVKATDPDLPPQNLTFSLVAPVPSDAVIDPSTGLLRWNLPTDSGASLQTLQIRVSDDAFPSASAITSLAVTVQPRFRVVFSEIMNHPTKIQAAYIELLNASAVTAWDISGCQLSGRSLSFTFPDKSLIQPRQTLCVVAQPDVFAAVYGSNISAVGPWTGNLGLEGDDLQLRASNGALLGRVHFSSSAPWPDQSLAGGTALQLIDPLADTSRVGNWTLSIPWTGPRSLISMTNSWRYFENGTPSLFWLENNFNDTNWKTGAGLFYVESADLPAAKKTPLTLGQWTYYFRTQFVLNQLPGAGTLALTHIIDDGAVFHLNGTELTRFNLAAETVVQPATPSSVSIGDATTVGPIFLPANLLRIGTNLLAVQVHQTSLTSSDIVFGATLSLDGTSQVGLSPGQITPGAVSLAEFPPVFLNEIQTSPGAFRDTAGEAEAWVEIINTGSTAISLANWTLNTSGASLFWTFPLTATLQPAERRLIVLDADPRQGTSSEWHASLKPTPTNGWISLARPTTTGSGIIDTLNYGQSIPDRTWSAQPEGQSFEHVWSTPTPGTENQTSLQPPPILTAIWNGTSLLIQWNSMKQANYEVQGADSPMGPWVLLKKIIGNGELSEVSQPSVNQPQHFYRVVLDTR